MQNYVKQKRSFLYSDIIETVSTLDGLVKTYLRPRSPWMVWWKHIWDPVHPGWSHENISETLSMLDGLVKTYMLNFLVWILPVWQDIRLNVIRQQRHLSIYNGSQKTTTFYNLDFLLNCLNFWSFCSRNSSTMVINFVWLDI